MHASRGGFERVGTPVDVDLIDVAVAGRSAFAVGERGVVLERGSRTAGWTLRDAGEWPTTGGADRVDPPTLTGVDATAEGERLWFAGEDGCVGSFDAKRNTTLDFTPQTGDHALFTAVAVVGSARTERVFAADEQGRLVEGRVNGTSPTFDPPKRLAGGAEITGLASNGSGRAAGCDAEGHVFYWSPADGWTVREVTDRRLTGVALDGDELLLSTADGDVLRYEYETEEALVERTDATAFADIAARAGTGPGAGGAVAVGTSGVAGRTKTGWSLLTELSAVPYAVACGRRAVVVGADGTVFER